MSFTVTFRPEAEEDLLDAFRWYEEHRKGLGLDFFQVVDSCVSSIQDNPEAYPIIYKNVRRALLRRFPLLPVSTFDGIQYIGKKVCSEGCENKSAGSIETVAE